MTTRRAGVYLTVAMFAYMGGFAAIYIDKLWPTFRAISRALGG